MPELFLGIVRVNILFLKFRLLAFTKSKNLTLVFYLVQLAPSPPEMTQKTNE